MIRAFTGEILLEKFDHVTESTAILLIRLHKRLMRIQHELRFFTTIQRHGVYGLGKVLNDKVPLPAPDQSFGIDTEQGIETKLANGTLVSLSSRNEVDRSFLIRFDQRSGKSIEHPNESRVHAGTMLEIDHEFLPPFLETSPEKRPNAGGVFMIGLPVDPDPRHRSEASDQNGIP